MLLYLFNNPEKGFYEAMLERNADLFRDNLKPAKLKNQLVERRVLTSNEWAIVQNELAPQEVVDKYVKV